MIARCRTCDDRYSEFGDGWDGECPSCADKTETLTILDGLTRTVRSKVHVCGCGCWVWTGSLDRYGYAGFKFKGKRVLVHRYVFETVHDTLLGDLTVDHLCDRHRNCVNPTHMESVTRTENSERANHRRFHEGEVDRSACTQPSDPQMGSDRTNQPQPQGEMT